MKWTEACLESEGALGHDLYKVGDFISNDQFILKRFPVDCLRVMAVNPLIGVFKEIQFTMMLRWVAFGVNARFCLVLMRR